MHQMTSEWPCSQNSQKYPVYIKCQPSEVQQSATLEMHRMTSKWPWTLNNKKHRICNKYLPPRIKFSFVLLYGHPFSRYKARENQKLRKCIEWPRTDFEILKAKSTSYTLSNYTRSPALGQFCCTTSCLKIQGCRKSEKNKICTDDLKMTWNT